MERETYSLLTKIIDRRMESYRDDIRIYNIWKAIRWMVFYAFHNDTDALKNYDEEE
jgi:hypothetical protein